MISAEFPLFFHMLLAVDVTPSDTEVQGADCHDVADQHWINGNLPCEGDAGYAAEKGGFNHQHSHTYGFNGTSTIRGF
jgi:hypothetical protein